LANTTYGQDVKVDGMKFAVVARPPVVGGKVASHDAVPGVEKVVLIPGSTPPAKFAPLGGVAVIAKSTWAALKGRDALKITWDDGPNASYDSKAYRAMLEDAVRKPGKLERNEGNAEEALKSAAHVISAEYYSPHMAHVTMEPPAGDGAHRRRQMQSVGTAAKPRWHARGRRQAARGQARGCDDSLHPAGRRVRPQVEVRLCARSRHPVT
jgi:CO/xanthine dehydrogenase Mo-binding subunit